MTVTDANGLALSGANERSLAHYEQALALLRCYVGDPVAAVDAAIAESPGFTMAHLLRGWLHLLGTEPDALPVARAAAGAAAPLPANERERGHLAAVQLLADGHWHAASRAIEDVAIAFPRDALALQAGHQIDFFTGNARLLRDRIARALPAWSQDMPGYHAMLGMHAFGLEECGDYGAAEREGRRSIELEPRDGWAQHAVAHVLEMQGRFGDGVGWMRGNEAGWSRDSFFAVHNWWHLALYHLENGEIDQVLALFDGPIFGARSKVVLDLVDASALLWRLHLRGIDVGDRWDGVADNWAPLADAGSYAFNDLHGVLAFAASGRQALVETVLAAQDRAMRGDGDNAAFTREVGRPAVRAILAFLGRDYAGCVALLRAVRGIAHRFGGSHAQRDLIDLTLIEAALRGGDAALATALAAERTALKPQSPLARLLAQRAAALAPK
jgi:hypothetical protein